MLPRKKVQEGSEFILCNGKKASTISLLKKEIKKLSDDEFSFHVNDKKNDFYNWIRDCINPMYAENIKDKKTKLELLNSLK